MYIQCHVAAPPYTFKFTLSNTFELNSHPAVPRVLVLRRRPVLLELLRNEEPQADNEREPEPRRVERAAAQLAQAPQPRHIDL